MHQPWNHAEDIAHLFDDDRVTHTGLEERAWRSLKKARELEKLATSKGIPIIEPFSDTTREILSPSKDFYQKQLANFRCMPQAAEKASFAGLAQAVRAAIAEVINWISKDLFIEKLAEPAEDATSAENNSSVVLLFDFGGEKFLFTVGCHGAPAPTEAGVSRARLTLGIDLKTVKYVQVPHHGRKRALTSGLPFSTAFSDRKAGRRFSTKRRLFPPAKDGQPKHPARKVINAFQRRGARRFATQGNWFLPAQWGRADARGLAE